MMIRRVRWQIAGTLLCAGLLVLLDLNEAVETQDDKLTSSHQSPPLSRTKRQWVWNTIHVYEENPPSDPPVKIGKLINRRSSENTVFKLSGDGANEIFMVDDVGDIFVLAKLDREKKSNYTLIAELREKQTNQRVEPSDEFTIQVQDINDNSPVFSDNFTGSVIERKSGRVTVLTVKATDLDDPSTPNGKIRYTLLNGTNQFSIDENTGEISTVVGNFDREIQSQYKLIVQASDLPGNPNVGMSVTTIVTITIADINDNMATFIKGDFHFAIAEDKGPGFHLGILHVKDQDETQNKNPKFTIHSPYDETFYVDLNDEKDGILTLKTDLDYETKSSYKLKVTISENDVALPADNSNSSPWTTANIHITVIDVDEPPVFSQAQYNFSVKEGPIEEKVIGPVLAMDMDKTSYRIEYRITDPNSPVEINRENGQLYLKRELDRELIPLHTFLVTAEEKPPSGKGLTSNAIVNIKVLDINDNDPELVIVNPDPVYICEDDKNGTVIGVIGANDKDENVRKFRFTLAKKSSNFSLHDNLNNTAKIVLTHGGFSTESTTENILEIEITDGGTPARKSITPMHIRVCTCYNHRQVEYCRAYARSGVSASALIAILLCILTILVIVILFVLRKHYQKQTLVTLGKSAGDLHEQLVTYDEEGGGEMDTNGYDVSILSSACYDRSLRPTPGPTMYAVVKKPQALKGDMAMMIEVKKDEADHDRDGIPYDTLHIYGYEGTESLAGSLSSLDSSSSGSNLDYDFLNNWGPRFRTLAQLYGVDGSDTDESY